MKITEPVKFNYIHRGEDVVIEITEMVEPMLATVLDFVHNRDKLNSLSFRIKENLAGSEALFGYLMYENMDIDIIADSIHEVADATQAERILEGQTDQKPSFGQRIKSFFKRG